jgi:hypothetical protein
MRRVELAGRAEVEKEAAAAPHQQVVALSQADAQRAAAVAGDLYLSVGPGTLGLTWIKTVDGTWRKWTADGVGFRAMAG